MNRDDIRDLHREAHKLNQETANLHRQAAYLRNLEENLAELKELAAGLVAAGRCGEIQFQHYSLEAVRVSGPWTYAWPCIKTAGHPGDCGFGHMTVPVPDAPSSAETERRAAATGARAAQLDEEAGAGERQLEAEQAVVPEPGSVINVLERKAIRTDDKWGLTERNVPLIVLEAYPGYSVVVRAAEDDGRERHLIRSWHDPQYWFYVCGHPTKAGDPCRAAYLGHGPGRDRCHAHGAMEAALVHSTAENSRA